MAEIKVYRCYEHYRDPVCDDLKQMVDKERLTKKLSIVAEISTLSRQTIARLMDGTTRRPHYATVMALAGALGYRQNGFHQVEEVDIEAARAAAWKWRERQEAKKKAAKERLIAKRKAARVAGHPDGAVSHRR
jgi:hypothetical protein